MTGEGKRSVQYRSIVRFRVFWYFLSNRCTSWPFSCTDCRTKKSHHRFGFRRRGARIREKFDDGEGLYERGEEKVRVGCGAFGDLPTAQARVQ